MKESHWRIKARAVITRVWSETNGRPFSERMKALRDAHPFGQREMYPYKIWLDEVSKLTKKDVRKNSENCEREQMEAGQLKLI